MCMRSSWCFAVLLEAVFLEAVLLGAGGETRAACVAVNASRSFRRWCRTGTRVLRRADVGGSFEGLVLMGEEASLIDTAERALVKASAVLSSCSAAALVEAVERSFFSRPSTAVAALLTPSCACLSRSTRTGPPSLRHRSRTRSKYRACASQLLKLEPRWGRGQYCYQCDATGFRATSTGKRC